jgi:hypothetical protein
VSRGYCGPAAEMAAHCGSCEAKFRASASCVAGSEGVLLRICKLHSAADVWLMSQLVSLECSSVAPVVLPGVLCASRWGWGG